MQAWKKAAVEVIEGAGRVAEVDVLKAVRVKIQSENFKRTLLKCQMKYKH